MDLKGDEKWLNSMNFFPSLKKRLNRWAKSTGFIKRRRGLSAKDFLVLMTVGQLGIKHPSLAAMVDAVKSRISREALHQRFDESAVRYIQTCSQYVLKQKVSQGVTIKAKLLKRFERVMIADSSSWDVNPQLAGIFPGSGGSASAANCKLQLFYEYKGGELSFFEITAGTRPDTNYTHQLSKHIQAKDLWLTDLGYFCLETFHDIDAKGAFFLSRFLVRTKLFDAKTGSAIELSRMLKSLSGNAYQFSVTMGSEKSTRVRCRLICLRVSEQLANERRRRLKKEAKKKGRTPSQLHLALCDWTLMVTNIPESSLAAEMVRPFYSLRWQIELLFKQIKTVLCIHHANTANVHRLRCEVYGKLIMAVFIHRIHSCFNGRLWNLRHREVSMDKLYKRIQERAFIILQFILISVSKACDYLATEIPLLIKNCMKTHQLSRKTSLERIECDLRNHFNVYKVA